MKKGFTLVEMIVIMGVMTVLIGLVGISILGTQQRTSSRSSVTLIVSDLRGAQMAAMSGEATKSAGVYFSTNSYVVFKGDNFQTEDSDNLTVELPGEVHLSDINLPGSQVVFATGSGKVANFSANENSFVLETKAGEKKVFTINQYGSITSIN